VRIKIATDLRKMENLSFNNEIIKGVSFEILQAEDIRKQSVVEVKYSGKRTVQNGVFVNVENSLRDERLGPLNKRSKCKTCGKKMMQCCGHFGHIELSHPIYHIYYTRQVVQWLKAICFNCSACTMKSIPTNISKVNRGFQVNNCFRNSNLHTKCPVCTIKIPKYTWNKELQQVMRNGRVYDVYTVIEHLESIPEDLLKRFGCCHPKGMVQECIPCPPPTVRPPLMMGNSLVRGEDDLTYRLLQILKFNHDLKQIKETQRPKHVIKEAVLNLQYAISSYIDHKKGSGGDNKAYDKEYTSLKKRLTSKEGRVRGNLMGKRCDFSARSVIGGDDFLPVGSVGVPEDIAKTLTVPVAVTAWNKKTLQEEFKKTNSKVKFIISPEGVRTDLKFINKNSHKLEVGWKVERELQDNDIVIFNRQPTLHLGSLMAHNVKVMRGRTIRMNLSATAPYNADFDGDEMNLHVPQTQQAQAEARHLMAVKYHIISAQSNSPVMGIVQDSMIGSYLLTQSSTRLTKSEFFQCIINMPGWDGTIKFQSKEFYTGLELFSMTLPMVNYEGCGVRIRCGIMESGQLTKGVLGTSHGSLIHVINNDCSPDACLLFMNRIQRVVHAYLQIRGFSMGISDIVSDNYAFIRTKCKEAYEKVKGETNEGKINTILNSCRDSVGKAVQEPLNQSNNLYCMVKSGAKGKISNISQVMGVVGQQNLAGARIPLTWEGRTLTHFKVGDNSPAARGFVESSFVNGLKPHEMWHHAVAGREGIIDTACKTARTGYVTRKLMKCLENLNVKGDLSVRNSDGCMIQFKYGEDGIDGKCVEKQLVDEFENIERKKMSKKEYQRCLEADRYLKEINEIREPIYKNTKFWMLPVPIDRIILNAQTIFSVGIGSKLTQAKICKRVKKLVDEIDNVLLQHVLTLKLNSFKLLKLKVTDEHMDQIYTDIKTKYEQALIPQGESVGSIASQSIGEFITQMTLNTFHNTGNSSMNVTLGIPRMLELIDCSTKIQTPVTSFVCNNAEEVARKLKLVKLEEIVDYYKVTNSPDEKEVEAFMNLPDIDFKPSKLKETLVLYLKEWYDIESVKQCILTQKNMSVAYTEGPYPIFHIKYIKEDKKSLDYLYEHVIRHKRIRGEAEIVEIIQENGITTVNTSMTDLTEIWGLGIAMNRVETNDVNAIMTILGLEAARKKLIIELTKILAFYGLYVNHRHISLLVNWMTHKGKLIPLTRHGIKQVDSSTLKMATFEEIVNVFVNAAYLQEEDDLKGISERILCGAPPLIGTNTDIDLLVDWDVFHKNKKDEPMDVDEEESAWNFNQWDESDDEEPWLKDTTEEPVISQNYHGPMVHQQMYKLPPSQLAPVQPVLTDVQLTYDPSPLAPAYGNETPTSPAYNPDTPPMSPAYSPTSPMYSPTSPCYSPKSSAIPVYDPESCMNPEKKRRTFFE
jgi:DNA-directed RNA polymerase II subunit RPB1